MAEFIPEDLISGEPVLRVRWRLQNRALPLMNRHLRAFTKSGVSAGLSSWAHQHIEWTLAEGTADYPNGVLMIALDNAGHAVMTVEPYEPLPPQSACELIEYADARRSQPIEGDVIWLARDGAFTVCTDESKPLSGANSLMVDLAKTLKIPVRFDPDCTADYEAGPGDEVLLVSDEHGIVGASDATGPVCERFASYYERLLEQTKPDQMDRANLGL